MTNIIELANDFRNDCSQMAQLRLKFFYEYFLRSGRDSNFRTLKNQQPNRYFLSSRTER